jgi:hypothetical protein
VTDPSGGRHGYGGPNPVGGPAPAGGWGTPPPNQQQWPSGPPQQQWAPGPPPQQWPSGPPQQPPPGWDASGQPGWQQPPGQQFGGFPPPGPPRRNRKALLITIGAGVAVVLVVVIVGAIALVGRGGSSGGASDAGGAVQGYLEALAKGDAEAALSFGADQPASKEFLSDEILKQQIQEMPISNIRILGDDSQGAIGLGQVHVTANFGDQTSDTTFFMKKNGNQWRLDSAAARFDFSTQNYKALETVTAFGKPVGKSVVYLFPGYVEWGSNNKNLAVEGKPVLLDSLTGYSGANVPEVSLSDAGRSAIVANVKGLLDECARSRSLEPPGCPQRVYDYGAVDGTVAWQAPDANDVEISFSPYNMRATVSMSGDFGYSVQGRDGARVTGTDQFSLFGEADLDQSPPTIKWN